MLKKAPKPGRGRPLLGPQVRDEKLQVRVTEEERLLIEKALRKGETISDVGQHLLVSWARRRTASGS